MITIKDNYCNYVDPIGLDIGDFLIGTVAISGTLMFVPMCLLGRQAVFKHLTKIFLSIIFFFSATWVVIGSFIFIRTNLSCLESDRSGFAIYGLINWLCLTIFIFVVSLANGYIEKILCCLTQ